MEPTAPRGSDTPIERIEPLEPLDPVPPVAPVAPVAPVEFVEPADLEGAPLAAEPPDEAPPRRNLLRSAEFLLGVIVGGSAMFVGFGIFGLRGEGVVHTANASPVITGTAPAPTLTLSPTRAPTPRPTPTPSPTPRPTPSPTPTPTPTPSPTPFPTPTPFVPTPTPAAASEGPEAHVSPDLEALLPATIGGTPLHRTSPSIAADLEADPRAATAISLLRLIGKSPSDIRFARAMDDANPERFTALAFQIPGLDARMFGGALVNVVTNAQPGTVTSDITLAGKAVIKATPPNGGPSGYIYEVGDTAFAIQTTDETLAIEALSRLP